MPIDPEKVHDFDPDGVPTVGQLLVELENAPPAPVSEDEKAKRADGEYFSPGLSASEK